MIQHPHFLYVDDHNHSSSWVDPDNDGKLDLYGVVFSQDDLLYKNDGSSFSKDATNAIVTDGANFSIPGAWGDYNNDGLQDLFRGNSGTQNDDLFTNNGNFSFTKTTLLDGKATLGASWADFDNDGDLDLFVANYLNNGNLLYINSGSPNYTLTKIDTGALAEAKNCVGSAWGDIDNDGDLDLFVSNDGGKNLLYINNGSPNYSFTKVTVGDIVNDIGSSFGAVFGDYDNDGQLDLFVANHLSEENFLYHNDGNSNHWITIKCIGTQSNSAAIGARVYVKATINGNATWQMQEVSGQTGYNSQNLWLHFGLGDAAIIDTIIVSWPSGTIDTCTNIDSDKLYSALEGGCLSVLAVQEITDIDSPIQISVSPNPFNGWTVISYMIPIGNRATLKIYDAIGEEVFSLSDEANHSYQNRFMFNASNLSAGVYFCEIKCNQFSAYKKLMVEK